MNDRGIEKVVLMELQHRAGKNGVDAAIGLPPSPDAINARVVSFRVAFAILVDRQLLPLTPQIKQLQNVVEDLMKAQLRRRTAATDGEMRQDKLLKLPEPQLRRNRLPSVELPAIRPSRKLDLTRFGGVGRKPRTAAAYRQIRPPSETRNQLVMIVFAVQHLVAPPPCLEFTDGLTCRLRTTHHRTGKSTTAAGIGGSEPESSGRSPCVALA